MELCTKAPLRRYYETLRLLAAHPPALRCLRPAVPSEHLRFAPSRRKRSAIVRPRRGPPQRAIDRVLHVLKPGGVCIASTRFLYRYHPDPKDYYRFTWDSLEYLFHRFSHVEVHHHGSRVQAIWEMINAGGRSRVLLNILNPFFALFEFQQTRFPLGFVIYAQK